jgi:hypothetical protein
MKIGRMRLILLAALLALGFWGWRICFPDPERVIRNRLTELAHNASFSANEGTLARVYNAQALGKFFATNVQITVEGPGGTMYTLQGRDQLLEQATGARSALSGLKVEFPDITVALRPDQESAVADITAKGKVNGERDSFLQELRITFQKTGGQWLIRRVESMKTLS